MISFLLNERLVQLQSLDANTTVLEYLREVEGRTGSKEGCASGDCGACTVVIGKPENGRIRYQSINACITLMAALNGKQLITVEDLADDGVLHPVQLALVKHHGSQCGFCTPGFVMSMFSLWKSNEIRANREEVSRALAGNLCRCTGYRSIIDATLESCENRDTDQFDVNQSEIAIELASLAAGGGLENGKTEILVPENNKQLLAALAGNPDARILAGGTDLALEITQENKVIAALVYIGNIPALQKIDRRQGRFQVCAAVTLESLRLAVAEDYPDFARLLDRLGSLQIRSTGTLAGNVANASPIGDTPPVLLALGANLQLESATSTRTVAIDQFFTGYRETALAAGEFISLIEFPIADNQHALKIYKVSKREEDDISAVCVAFYLSLAGRKINTIRIGFGGMAATPMRALALEAALQGVDVGDYDSRSVRAAVESDFEPIGDVRATAQYRLTVATNLVRRLFEELSGNNTNTQIHHYAQQQAIGGLAT